MQNIDASIVVPFIRSTRSTFDVLLNLTLKQKEVYVKKNFTIYGDISGTIGISGSVSGFVWVSLPADFALDCIRALIREDADAVLSDVVVRDGISELITMIAGGAKKDMPDKGTGIDLALPTVISGRGHELYHNEDACNTSIIFETECGHDLALDVCIQKDYSVAA